MTKKQEILNRLKNTYCRLKPSKIEGVGLFAIRDIPKGVDPFFGIKHQRWYEFTSKELEGIDKEVLNMIGDFFVIEKDKSVYIPEYGLNSIDISFFINNSKTPNVKTTDGGLNFVTLREIKKGEEITTSYADYDNKYLE